MSFEAYIAANMHWLWDSGAEDDSRLTHSKRIAEGTGDNQANAGCDCGFVACTGGVGGVGGSGDMTIDESTIQDNAGGWGGGGIALFGTSSYLRLTNSTVVGNAAGLAAAAAPAPLS